MTDSGTTGSQKAQRERDTTDQSLRTEREKTDAELAGSLASIEDAVVESVAAAREQADSLVSEARDREDRKNAVNGGPEAAPRGLDDERALEDAASMAERSEEDAAVTDEVAYRQIALASLLAFEREDTDLRLEIERARADEALTSRDDFFAIVTHDLRSLLGGIALNAAMVTELVKSDEVMAKKAVRHAESIQRYCARMNRLIGDLFDVAGIEAGKLAVLPRRRDVARLIHDALEAFVPAAAAHRIQLSCETTMQGVFADFDYDRVLQVLSNLVGNAIKFTPEGGLITLRVESRGTDVVFAVTDTGAGIPEDQLEQVFDRLYQKERNDRRGLGLGLYIAKSIVEAHGGRIWAESPPGQGSTFLFALPARAAASPPRRNQAEPGPPRVE